MRLLLALGDVGDRIVAIMHDLVIERRALATTQGSGQGSTSRDPSVSMEQRLGPGFGVWHKQYEPKLGHIYARRFDQRVEEQEGLGHAGRRDCRMPWSGCNRWRGRSDQAWGRAEELFFASGFRLCMIGCTSQRRRRVTGLDGWRRAEWSGSRWKAAVFECS